jgi:hypothetical protein
VNKLQQSVMVLGEAFPLEILTRLGIAAQACRFPPISHSVRLEALRDFGIADLLAPVRLTGIDSLAAEVMGRDVECRLAESWVRKRFAPCNAPPHYHPNSWHQDGGLGVKYGAAGEVGPMTQLVTCWIPLQDCGTQSPGLEFVRQTLPGLLHYEDLNDRSLRQRFAPELFWSPELHFGDAVLFRADILHRTHATPAMQTDRLSIEYRFFPR